MSERDFEKARVFMTCALAIARLSRATRLKVGALLIKEGRILSTGYNGDPTGGDNVFDGPDGGHVDIVHAEVNAVCYAARQGIATQGATVYCTHAPCVPCALTLIQAGVVEVVYREIFKDADGLNLLAQYGVKTWRLS